MTAERSWGLGCIVLLGWVAYLAVAANPAAAAADPAAWMYQPGLVNVIELELPQESIEALEADPESDYQPGTFSFAQTDGTPGGVGQFSAPLEVGIRLKGSSGSFLPLGQKAGFKVKFGKKQPFLGLRKMTLNNMVQDPSMLHETLAYKAFQALGVPAPRTSFAQVLVNGQDYGLHLNVEALDKVALEKRFGPFAEPPQHLYEGEAHADVVPGQEGLFEVDEGDGDDLGDLDALVAAVNDASAPDWSGRVDPFADLAEMTRMWAVEKYVGHWDGYSGIENSALPNNFYLYSDPAGEFQMIPWGTDQTWSDRLEFDGSASGALFAKCLQDASCEALYSSAAGEALASIPALDLDTLGRCTALRLGPWQELEPPVMQPNDTEQIAAAVDSTREFIADRPGELAAWLETDAPDVPSGEPCPPYPPMEELPPSPPGPGQVLPAPPAQRPVTRVFLDGPLAPLRLGRVAIDGRTLKVQLKVPASGRLRLDVMPGAAITGPSLCRGHSNASAPGSVSVSCRLPREIRRKLEAHWLRLSLRVTFETAAGVSELASRVLKLPRQ